MYTYAFRAISEMYAVFRWGMYTDKDGVSNDIFTYLNLIMHLLSLEISVFAVSEARHHKMMMKNKPAETCSYAE